MAAIGLAVAIYAVVAFVLRIRETTEFIAVVSRRLSRRRKAA
jgi:biopolymer transport protein ExbB/TolQ